MRSLLRFLTKKEYSKFDIIVFSITLYYTVLDKYVEGIVVLIIGCLLSASLETYLELKYKETKDEGK